MDKTQFKSKLPTGLNNLMSLISDNLSDASDPLVSSYSLSVDVDLFTSQLLEFNDINLPIIGDDEYQQTINEIKQKVAEIQKENDEVKANVEYANILETKVNSVEEMNSALSKLVDVTLKNDDLYNSVILKEKTVTSIVEEIVNGNLTISHKTESEIINTTNHTVQLTKVSLGSDKIIFNPIIVDNSFVLNSDDYIIKDELPLTIPVVSDQINIDLHYDKVEKDTIEDVQLIICHYINFVYNNIVLHDYEISVNEFMVDGKKINGVYHWPQSIDLSDLSKDKLTEILDEVDIDNKYKVLNDIIVPSVDLLKVQGTKYKVVTKVDCVKNEFEEVSNEQGQLVVMEDVSHKQLMDPVVIQRKVTNKYWGNELISTTKSAWNIKLDLLPTISNYKFKGIKTFDNKVVATYTKIIKTNKVNKFALYETAQAMYIQFDSRNLTDKSYEIYRTINEILDRPNGTLLVNNMYTARMLYNINILREKLYIRPLNLKTLSDADIVKNLKLLNNYGHFDIANTTFMNKLNHRFISGFGYDYSPEALADYVFKHILVEFQYIFSGDATLWSHLSNLVMTNDKFIGFIVVNEFDKHDIHNEIVSNLEQFRYNVTIADKFVSG